MPPRTPAAAGATKAKAVRAASPRGRRQAGESPVPRPVSPRVLSPPPPPPAAPAEPPRRWAAVALLLALPAPILVFQAASVADASVRRLILITALLSAGAFWATLRLVPPVRAATLRRGLFGMDINKRGTPAGEVKARGSLRRGVGRAAGVSLVTGGVPEAVGLAPGAAFLGAVILFQWLHFAEGALPAAATAPAHAGLGCISAALLLGFVDDVLDVPWRVKFTLPALAAVPLLLTYTGATGVIVPLPLRGVLGAPFLELGALYKAYMCALAVFCTNSINILAGLNGLEVGQTLVLALACLLLNLSVLAGAPPPATQAAHALSLSIVAPLAAVSAALLCFNWYPAAVFVGDTYTLFAGMALAVAGILGHYSETLLLLFTPQVFNFLYSLPQLLRLVPCPRHRLPTLDPATGLLHATPNYNLVNLALQLGGPRSERGLCTLLLGLQAGCACGAFALRAALAGHWKV